MKTTLLTLFILFTSINSFACDCMNINVENDFKNATEVFTARVIAVRQNKAEEGQGSFQIVKIEITKSLKGDLVGTIEIATGIGGPDCGFNFSVGEEYLIFSGDYGMYGDKGDGIFETTRCSNNDLVSNSKSALKLIDRLTEPDIKK